MGTVRQGNVGKVSAMEWLVRTGAVLRQPLIEHPTYDFVADLDGRLVCVG